MQLNTRMQREVRMLQTDPPPGVWAAPKNGDRLTELEAQIQARLSARLCSCWRLLAARGRDRRACAQRWVCRRQRRR